MHPSPSGRSVAVGPTVSGMFAISLDEAKTIAIVGVTALVVGAVVSLWIMKTLIQKVAAAVLLGLLAFAVWSQRESLQDCADKVQENYERTGTDVTVADTDCSFFGFTVTISDPRSE